MLTDSRVFCVYYNLYNLFIYQTNIFFSEILTMINNNNSVSASVTSDGNNHGTPSSTPATEAIYGGSSPLSSAGGASLGVSEDMVVDPLEGLGSGDNFSQILDEELPIDGDADVSVASMIEDIKSAMKREISVLRSCQLRGDAAGMRAAQEMIDAALGSIASLEKCNEQVFDRKGKGVDYARNSVPSTAAPAVSVVRSGLSLSQKDLPKFQLSTDMSRPFPQDPCFESVDQFLRKWERTVSASVHDINQVWKQFLPVSIPDGNEYWLEQTLLSAASWEEAKRRFKAHFESENAVSDFTCKVFRMEMKPNESVVEYSRKYLDAMYQAGLPRDDFRVAQCFVSSLVPAVRFEINSQLMRIPGPHSVEAIAKVARKIFGDSTAAYGGINSRLSRWNSFASSSSASSDSRRGQHGDVHRRSRHGGVHKSGFSSSSSSAGGSSFKPSSSKKGNVGNTGMGSGKYFCTQHGENGTHNTSDCIVLKKRTQAKQGNLCYRCSEPWSPGHKCTEKPTRKNVFSVHKKDDRGVETATSTSDEDPIDLEREYDEFVASSKDVSDGDQDMEDNFDCKYHKLTKEVVNRHTDSLKIRTPIRVDGKVMLGLCDTGSDCTVINFKVVKHLKLNKNKNGTLKFLDKNNDTSSMGLTTPLKIEYLNGISFSHSFDVLDFDEDFDFDVLLGTDILPKLNISLQGVAHKPDNTEFTRSDLDVLEDNFFDNLNHDLKGAVKPDASPVGSDLEREKFMITIGEALLVNSQISEHSSCPMPESIVYLPTPPGATAVRRQYPIPHKLIPVLNEQIEKWLKSGTIRKCRANTQFNSPLLLVPKRNKEGIVVSYRVCLDVRLLNQILPPTFNYPVPLVKTIFAKLSGKKVFTTLDLSNAYHRFAVAKEDQTKLTFTHLDGQQYCFQKACFGLKFLTSQFSKCLAILFDGLTCVQNFVDDAVVASESLEQHAIDVRMVIERLNSVNLILNPDKCVFAQKAVRLLGFVVDASGTRVDTNKITNVESWGVPQSAKQVQSFLGLVNYFRDYIPMMARVAAPISRISHAPNVKELWGLAQDKAFKALKEMLQSKVILKYPDWTKKFYVATDASQFAVSALLFQKDGAGRDIYISFISCSLSPSQRRWSTTKRELFAVVVALKKYREYLFKNPFTLYTDHKALVYLHTQKVANNLILSWYETLMEFDFDVVHLPGILNRLADSLSRLYPPIEECEHKLVEDNGGKGKRKLDKSRVVKRKRYSSDNKLNVLAIRGIANKKKHLDYICPPENERQKLLTEMHKLGHASSVSVVRDLHDQGMHWNGIYDEAKVLVDNCSECQKHNIVQRGYHPITNVVSYRPFDHISIDLAGPLPMSSDGCMYILVVVDICTKYIIIRGLKDKQSTTVAKHMLSIFGDFGIARIINMDNGLEFKNAVFKQIADNLNIERRYSVPYHPQANPAESAVKIAMNTLRKMINSNTRDWSVFLPLVQLCINRQIKKRSLSSPFSLMFARRVNLPDDYTDKAKYPVPAAIMTQKELEDRIEHMEDLVFPAIKQRSDKINEMINKAYNESHKLVDIPDGAFVMVRLPQRSNKLAALYDGPYTVIRKTQGGSYILKTPETNELLPRNYTPSELKIVQVSEEAIDDFYEVEKILAHRGPEGNREFLVKWSGYSEEHNSWESAGNFSSTATIQKYWDEVDSKKGKSNSSKKLENGSHTPKHKKSDEDKMKKLDTSNAITSGKNKRKSGSEQSDRAERLSKRRAIKGKN